MAKQKSTGKKILVSAEKRMREGGFHGFSFREIAADVGIKSASVHHHFPTKDDLAAEVVRDYTKRHFEALGDATDGQRRPDDLVAHYIGLFRDDVVKDRMMCLCGVLAGESASLSPVVRAEVDDFFERNRQWLETVLGRLSPELSKRQRRARALMVTATLEGALLSAICTGEQDIFDKVSGELKRLVCEQ